MQRKFKLYLFPKPIGSSYGLLKFVHQDTCKLPKTTATLIVESVNPEASTEQLLKWLKEAPGLVGKMSEYNLAIVEEK